MTDPVHDVGGVHVLHAVDEHASVRFQMRIVQRQVVVEQHFR